MMTEPGTTDAARWTRLFIRRMEVETVEAVKLFRSFDIEPLVIKGWAAARNYPEKVPRVYADVDLAVSPEEFKEAVVVRNTTEGLRQKTDLHCSLRHLDTRKWDEIFADSLVVQLDGYGIRIPSPEDHLRLLAVHWLADGGEQKEKLWDIYYAVANRPADFDWDKCLGAVAPNRRKWIISTIGLADRYLGLNIEDLPFAAEARDLPAWLIETLELEWKLGVRTRNLRTTIGTPREFVRQVRKRFPPNPIQSTIENEGDLVNGPIRRYQALSMVSRSLLSVKRIVSSIKAGK